MAYADSIRISVPSPQSYSDGDMAGFSDQYKKTKANERKAALRKSVRNLKNGTLIQYALSIACFYHGARYALTMGEDSSTVIGGWTVHYKDWAYTLPSATTNALLYVVCIVCLIAAGTFFAARLPELFAQFKIVRGAAAKFSIALVIIMHTVAIGSSSGLSWYTTQSILQFSNQSVTDASETAVDRATAALELKDEYENDLADLEQDILTVRGDLRAARAADTAHVASAKNYPQDQRGWVLNFKSAGGLRKPFYDAVLKTEAKLAALEKTRAELKARKLDATQSYRDAIEAPNSVEKSLEEQGKAYGGVSPERLNLIISQIMSFLIEFFRITLSIVSQTSLAHALINFTVSEHQRRSKEAEAEWEAEDRQRRYEEATLAPIRAKEEGHLRMSEAHAERVRARVDASVEAIKTDDDPDEWIFNTDASAAIEATPDDESLSIPPMPSERAVSDPAASSGPTNGPAPFSAMMAVDSAEGYDDLSDFYQDAVRRAEQSWRGGSHHFKHSTIQSGYGIKSNDARKVFLRWLEKSGRATSKETPTGRKYTKVRIT